MKALQACPEFKGIKTALLRVHVLYYGFKLALNSKGLRLCVAVWLDAGTRLQACPEFKGIKTDGRSFGRWKFRLQACPEFKGIKTSPCATCLRYSVLQACPEFKGIKTSVFVNDPAFRASSLP